DQPEGGVPMQRPGRAVLAIVLSFLLLPLPLFAAAAPPVGAMREIRLPVRGFAFANRGDNGGGVAVLDPTGDLVVLYPKLMSGSLEGGVQMRVGRLPLSMI